MARTVYYDYQGNEIDPPFEPPVVTNSDRIRSMTDEELAKFFLDCVACDDCPVGKSKCKREWAKCTDAALSWLKSPAEEGEQE